MRALDFSEINGFSFHNIQLPFLFGRNFDGRLCRDRGFRIRGLAVLGKCLLAGHSITKSAEESRVTRRKATAFREVIVRLFGELYCPCGRKSNHIMGCKWRFDQSLIWQEALRKCQQGRRIK